MPRRFPLWQPRLATVGYFTRILIGSAGTTVIASPRPIHSDESHRQAFGAATPADDPGIGFGFAWRITGETPCTSGETMGFRNVFVRYRAALTIVARYLNQ